MSRPYVVGDSSPFLKRVLIPFWVVRIIIMLIYIAVFGILVTGLGVYKDRIDRLEDDYGTTLNYDAVLAAACIIMAITLVCLILDIVCIIKRARRTLTPPFFLGVNIAQSIIFLVEFILSMIGPRPGSLTVIIGVLILLSFLGLLVYAAVVFHQYRKGSLQARGTYVQANHPEAHNLVANTGYPGIAPVPVPHTSYPQQSYVQEYPPKAAGQAYDGQAAYASPAYEPYRQTTGHGQPQEQQPPQQGYEMHQRSAA